MIAWCACLRYSKGVTTPHRFVRTRLYFTSESHIHSLMTTLRYGALSDTLTDEQWARAIDYYGTVSELNYLSQIVIMVYEDANVPEESEERFHVELHFSPGAYTIMQVSPSIFYYYILQIVACSMVYDLVLFAMTDKACFFILDVY